MASQEKADRLERLHKLREQGIDPYPPKANRTHHVNQVLDGFADLLKKKDRVTIAGRIRSSRKHGGLIFANIEDESGNIQVAIKKDIVGEDKFSDYHELFDVGDFLEVTGPVFVTKTEQKTIEVNEYRLLTKTILPLPEKWHGLTDTEKRFRQRYLDLIINQDVKGRIALRSKIIKAIRDYLGDLDFVEVETPTLQPVYGGGFARPFKTHHNALDADFFLRISDEMYLKRMLVGGMEKVFEITKVFRNEGIDKDHNPEFTMLEAQIAYEDYNYGMDLFEGIFEAVAKNVFNNLKIKNGEETLSFKAPWKRMRLVEAVETIGKIKQTAWKDLNSAKAAVQKKIDKAKYNELDKFNSVGEVMAFAFEELVEERLVQPTIIYDYPVEVSPLAKKSADDLRFVERFEAFILGSEVGNNYSELNDPEDLEKRFIEEKNKEKAGFDEAHQTDDDYLEAIMHGMPPACGIGIGIDRLVMMFTDANNIKEVIAFPTLRPKSND